MESSRHRGEIKVKNWAGRSYSIPKDRHRMRSDREGDRDKMKHSYHKVQSYSKDSLLY